MSLDMTYPSLRQTQEIQLVTKMNRKSKVFQLSKLRVLFYNHYLHQKSRKLSDTYFDFVLSSKWLFYKVVTKVTKIIVAVITHLFLKNIFYLLVIL